MPDFIARQLQNEVGKLDQKLEVASARLDERIRENQGKVEELLGSTEDRLRANGGAILALGAALEQDKRLSEKTFDLLVDMQPRVLMLNHWHDDVDEWRAKVDGKLATLTRLSILVAGVTMVKSLVETYFQFFPHGG